MPDDGRNGGITGLVDLPGLGSGQKFVVRVYKYEQALVAGTETQGARGDTAFVPSQYTFTTGNVVLRGKIRLDGYPLPTPFNGVAGSLTIQYHTGVTETVAVKVVSSSITHSEPTTDTADITLGCEITADPTFAGFGTGAQATAAATTGTTRELWAGVAKSIDPQSLIEGATQVFDVYGVTDADAAEVTAISTAISAATTPVSNLKLRPMSMSRVNAYRIRLTYQWSRTSTADDVLLPIRRKNIDAGNLASSETVAAINATASASTLTGTTLVSRTVTQLHDNATLNVADYGPRTATQAEEQPRTQYATDSTELNDREQVGVVHNTGSTPATPSASGDLVVVNTTIQPLTSLKSVTTFEFERTTSQNKAIYGKAFVELDPGSLTSRAMTAAINATAAVTAGFVSRGTTTINLTPQHTLVTTEGGLRTTAEDIERPGTYVTTDPEALEGRGQATVVFTTGSEPSNGSQTAAGLTLAATTVRYEHSGKGVKVWSFAENTSKQEREYAATETKVATGTVGSESTQAQVYATGSPPSAPTVSGQKLRWYVDKPLTDNRTLRVWQFGISDLIDEIENAKFRYLVCPSGIRDTEIGAQVWLASGSAPSTPTPTNTSLVLYETEDVKVDELYKLRIWTFRRNTPKMDIERPGTWVVTDPSGLEGNAQTIEVFDTGSEPSDASQTAAGLTLASTTLRFENSGKGVKTWKFAENTAKQEREYGKTTTKVGTSVVGSESTRAEVWDSTGAAPTAPTISGQKLQFYVDYPLTNDRTLRVWQFGISDLIDEIENAKFQYLVCPSGIRDEEVAAQVWLASGSAPSTPTPTNTSLQLFETVDLKVDELYKVRIWRFRRDTPETELENRNTDAGFDENFTPYSSVATLAASSGSAESQAAGLVSTYRNSGLFQSVRVTKPTPNTLLTEVRSYTTSFCATTMTANGEPRLMMYRSTGSGAAAVAQVYVRDTIRVDANRRWYLLGPVIGTYADGYMDLSVKRSVTGYLPLETVWYGSQNDASFAGMLPYTLQLVGTSIRDNPAAALSRMAHLVYRFYYDSRGHFDQSGIPTEWFMANSSTAPVVLGVTGSWATTTGWTNAVNVGIAVPLLPVATFSGLIP